MYNAHLIYFNNYRGLTKVKGLYVIFKVSLLHLFLKMYFFGILLYLGLSNLWITFKRFRKIYLLYNIKLAFKEDRMKRREQYAPNLFFLCIFYLSNFPREQRIKENEIDKMSVQKLCFLFHHEQLKLWICNP